MTDDELEKNRLKLVEIERSDNPSQGDKRKQLDELAETIGASKISTFHQKAATDGELARNIHDALQTASMVNMCKTAAQGYEMATEASKSASIASKNASKQFRKTAWIGAITALAACLSAGAALFAVFRN